jgi:hypothetical protein
MATTCRSHGGARAGFDYHPGATRTNVWTSVEEGAVIHASNILYETLDGETIVIHLETGSYYSLTGSGAEIWDLLAEGRSVTQVRAALAQRYASPESEISGPVEKFIAELEREALVEPSDPSPNGLPTQAADAKRTWEPPKLECYDDMRDFLLVDPIHEVDERGWPSRKAAK